MLALPYESFLHPPYCPCCGGGNIEIDYYGWQELLTENMSYAMQSSIADIEAQSFLGSDTNVTRITQNDLSARRADMGLSDADWGYEFLFQVL